MTSWQILEGDCRERLADLDAGSVHTVVTSPPYFGLRDYGHGEQIGLEATPDEFCEAMVEVFQAVRRVLRDDGTVWLNLGDSYAGGGSGARDPERWPKQSRNDHMVTHAKTRTGLKNKDLIGIPWMVAFALRADGWYLRSDIIWAKPNPMPESVTDRPTKAHEYLFLLSKGPRYHFDADAIREDSDPDQEEHNQRYAKIYDGPATAPENGQPGNVNNGGIHSRPGPGGRNKRSVWTISTTPFPGAHFATFPPALIEPCILAGCPEGGTVLDPFSGAGTTGMVALRRDRSYIGIELNPEYVELSRHRIQDDAPLLNTPLEVAA